jgi:hypothetical protein
MKYFFSFFINSLSCYKKILRARSFIENEETLGGNRVRAYYFFSFLFQEVFFRRSQTNLTVESRSLIMTD